MKKHIIAAICIAMALSACSGDNKNDPYVNTPPPAIATATPPPVSDEEDPLYPEFILTEQETALYENYVKNLDKSIFIGVPPASIVKVFIQCYVNGDWEAEYQMYNENSRTATKEELQAAYGGGLTDEEKENRKLQADYYYLNLDTSEFRQTDDKTGKLIFLTSEEDVANMFLMMHPDGYWELYRPAFTLTTEEEKLYKEYLKNKNMDVFKNVSLEGTVKVLAQSWINGEMEGGFTLYGIESQGYLPIGYEPLNSENPDADRSNREQIADMLFINMDGAVFTEISNGLGYLSFNDAYEETNVVYFNKTGDKWEPFTPSFELAADEKALYDEFFKDYDRSVFKNVSPAIIAKIYIQYGINAKWEAEYEITNPESRTQTKEEARAANSKDLNSLELSSRKTMADQVFPFLGSAVFTEDGSGKGHLTFKNLYLDEMNMHFIKNANGYWELKFDPFNE